MSSPAVCFTSEMTSSKASFVVAFTALHNSHMVGAGRPPSLSSTHSDVPSPDTTIRCSESCTSCRCPTIRFLSRPLSSRDPSTGSEPRSIVMGDHPPVSASSTSTSVGAGVPDAEAFAADGGGAEGTRGVPGAGLGGKGMLVQFWQYAGKRTCYPLCPR